MPAIQNAERPAQTIPPLLERFHPRFPYGTASSDNVSSEIIRTCPAGISPGLTNKKASRIAAYFMKSYKERVPLERKSTVGRTNTDKTGIIFLTMLHKSLHQNFVSFNKTKITQNPAEKTPAGLCKRYIYVS
ncbi:MAG: hypothetical protein IJM41_06180 [Bacteroidales bacterium]|nr:hypothetical protein [Bacteroidales bacterium]